MLRRTNRRLVRLTSPLWSSLLLAGCDAMPRMPRESVTLESPIDSRLPANSTLRPCAEPSLMAPGSNSSEVLATSHPMELQVQRLPAIPRPFPSSELGVPLSVTLPQQLAPRVARSQPRAAAINGPSLFPPPGLGTNAATAPASRAQAPLPQSGGLNGEERDNRLPATIIRSQPGPSSGPRLRTQPAVRPVFGGRAAAKAGEAPRTFPSNARQGGAAPLSRRPARSPELEAVARQAQRQVRGGFSLAARGALYSARAQFIRALRTIAQALDVRSGDRRHSEALGAGLDALHEAEDFAPRGSRVEANLDIGTLVRGHNTPVLKNAPAEELAAVTAQQRYYTYAQEQLAVAAGGVEAGSMALFGLGKTYGTLAKQRSPQVVAPESKAMVYHQAAVTTAPGNYLAANELAVLAAQYGRYETARTLLQYSVALAPQADIWRNLAVVHRRLGETELAELAEEQAAAAAQRDAAGKTPPELALPAEVQWLDPKEFAVTSKPATDLQTPTLAEPIENPAASTSPRPGWLAPWSRQTSQQGSPSAARR